LSGGRRLRLGAKQVSSFRAFGLEHDDSQEVSRPRKHPSSSEPEFQRTQRSCEPNDPRRVTIVDAQWSAGLSVAAVVVSSDDFFRPLGIMTWRSASFLLPDVTGCRWSRRF